MVGKINNNTKKYTVADLYSEAMKMVKNEMHDLKKGSLTPNEKKRMEELAKVISNSVLKEMKII